VTIAIVPRENLDIKLLKKREYANAWKRAYRKKHPIETKRIWDKWYAKKRIDPLWIQENRSKARLYYETHREKIRAIAKQWDKDHPDIVKARHLRYRLKHPNYQREYVKHKSQLRRLQLFDILKQHVCIKCACSDKRALTFDHINGKGGQTNLKMFGTRSTRYEYYIKHPDEFRREFQVLCANCNIIKKFENGEVGLYAIVTSDSS
jgi:hypothetical protein